MDNATRNTQPGRGRTINWGRVAALAICVSASLGIGLFILYRSCSDDSELPDEWTAPTTLADARHSGLLLARLTPTMKEVKVGSRKLVLLNCWLERCYSRPRLLFFRQPLPYAWVCIHASLSNPPAGIDARPPKLQMKSSRGMPNCECNDGAVLYFEYCPLTPLATRYRVTVHDDTGLKELGDFWLDIEN